MNAAQQALEKAEDESADEKLQVSDDDESSDEDKATQHVKKAELKATDDGKKQTSKVCKIKQYL